MRDQTNAVRIGLTGGIGSGKSLVADMLGGLGADIIDTDVIAHALTAPQGGAMQAIRAAFGPDVVGADGALDRAAMRARVFADAGARRALEDILHPMIYSEVQRQAEQASGAYPVFVVPLLVESGRRWRERVDRICVVDCLPQDQVARVQARNGLTPEMIGRIMDAQATREQRLVAADDVIDNRAGTSLDALAKRVQALHSQWLALSAT